MKSKIGMSIYERIVLWIIIICNGVIITCINNKTVACLLVVGVCFSALCPYNAAKTIEAYFHNQENIKKSSLASAICFLIGFFASGISVFLLFDNWLAYVFWMLYHLLIFFVTIPLILIGKQVKALKETKDGGDKEIPSCHPNTPQQ